MLRALVFVLCTVVAVAMYEDQLGEADWKIENIGTIQHSIYQDKKLVVTTEQGVLALLQQNSGKTLWRDVLPTGDHVDSIVTTPERIIGLCNGGTLLRSWGFANGELQWETSLVKVSDTPLNLPSQVLDLTVDAAAGFATILQDNCVNYVNVVSGDVSWFWCPSDGDLLVLSHLIPTPPTISTTTGDEYRRSAVACRVTAPSLTTTFSDGDAAGLVCRSPVVLTAYLPPRHPTSAADRNKKHSMELTDVSSKLDATFNEGGIAVGGLRSVFSDVSVASKGEMDSFGPFDMLYSARIATTTATTAIFALPLSSSQSSLSLTTITHNMPSNSVVATLGALGNGNDKASATTASVYPVVSFCQSRTHLSVSPDGGCEVFALSIGTTASSSDDDSSDNGVVATKIVSCNPDSPTATDYIGSAVVAVERGTSSAWGGLRAVGCSQLLIPSASTGSGLRVVTKATKYSIVRGEGSGGVTATVDVPTAAHGHSLLASIQAVHIQIFNKPSDKGGGEHGMRGMVVSGGVGSTFLFQGDRSVWVREEALAHIKQVLMIPRPFGSDSEDSSGSSSSGDVAGSLSFTTRLRLQYSELSHYWHHTYRYLSIHTHLAVLHMLDADSRKNTIKQLMFQVAGSIGLPVGTFTPTTTTTTTTLHDIEVVAAREDRDNTGLQFGFDKYAIVLSHNGSSSSSSDDATTLSLSATDYLSDAMNGRGVVAGVKVLALDLIHGEVAWSVQPNMTIFASHIASRRISSGGSGSSGDRVQVYVKLLPGATRRDETYASGSTSSSSGSVDPLAHGIGAALYAVSMRYIPSTTTTANPSPEDVLTCVWHLDVHSGHIHTMGSSSGSDNSNPTVCLPVGPGAVVGVSLVDRLAAAQILHTTAPTATDSSSSGGSLVGGTYTHLLLRHDDLSVSAYPPTPAATAAATTPQYVHVFDSTHTEIQGGGMTTYLLQRGQKNTHPAGCPVVFNSLHEHTHAPVLTCPEHVTYALSVVGSALTHTATTDTVLCTAYPTPHDKATSRAYVLGDKSLLLKYLNPNIAVVVTESIVDASEDDATTVTTEVEGGSGSSISHLVVSVMDTVTARVIYRYEIPHGKPTTALTNTAGSSTSSVQAAIVENAVVVTYWNYKAQRTELSSLVLYEGMISRTGLGPVTSFQSPVSIDISSFSAPQPIGLQKTYVLPKAVATLTHTLTLKGLTNKHLLVGLKNGQVYRLDMRHVDPRRPLTAPTQAEKEEGLMQYNPFLPLIPQNAVTINGTVAGLRGLVSTPSLALESASLVLVFGLDVFFTRVSPSKGFDMLSSEFNRPLLTLILGIMLLFVLFLRKLNRNKIINTAWA